MPLVKIINRAVYISDVSCNSYHDLANLIIAAAPTELIAELNALPDNEFVQLMASLYDELQDSHKSSHILTSFR